MKYSVDEEIFASYPDFSRAVVHAWGLNNTHHNPQLESLLRKRIEMIERDVSIGDEHPRVCIWREVYSSFPIPDAKHLIPSVAGLIRRIRKGQGARLPFVYSLVCISNLISLTYFGPSGLVDASRVRGNLQLGKANGDETFIPFGTMKSVAPQLGEIIYYDASSKAVLCRAWNSKGGEISAIRKDTEEIILDIDGMSGVISSDELREASKLAGQLISTYCGGDQQLYYLDKSIPSIDLELRSKSKEDTKIVPSNGTQHPD